MIHTCRELRWKKFFRVLPPPAREMRGPHFAQFAEPAAEVQDLPPRCFVDVLREVHLLSLLVVNPKLYRQMFHEIVSHNLPDQ